jgi:hypothetical protein
MEPSVLNRIQDLRTARAWAQEPQAPQGLRARRGWRPAPISTLLFSCPVNYPEYGASGSTARRIISTSERILDALIARGNLSASRVFGST